MALRIYTKTGDDGTTGLFGGTRVAKNDLRIEAYGTVDELNAVIGIALTHELPDDVRRELTDISSLLFTLGADLATPLDPPPTYHIPRIAEEHVSALERLIDRHDDTLAPLKAFILPGGTKGAAYLHLARTVCRRAERCIVALAAREDIGDHVVHYVNRLSDYLFTAARAVNHAAGVADVPWRPQA
jgi:cob(I)alamin adenosyltransferase